MRIVFLLVWLLPCMAQQSHNASDLFSIIKKGNVKNRTAGLKQLLTERSRLNEQYGENSDKVLELCLNIIERFDKTTYKERRKALNQTRSDHHQITSVIHSFRSLNDMMEVNRRLREVIEDDRVYDGFGKALELMLMLSSVTCRSHAEAQAKQEILSTLGQLLESRYQVIKIKQNMYDERIKKLGELYKHLLYITQDKRIESAQIADKTKKLSADFQSLQNRKKISLDVKNSMNNLQARFNYLMEEETFTVIFIAAICVVVFFVAKGSIKRYFYH